MANQFSKIRKFTKKQYRRAINSGFDFNMLVALVFLLAFGLIMVFSAGSEADFKDQLAYDLLSLGLMTAIIIFAPLIWNKLKTKWFMILYYAVATIPVILVLPFGVTINNAKRWIKIGGRTIQPAEFTKTCMILFMAALLIKMGDYVNTWIGILICAICAAVPAGLILVITNNLSSALIVATICIAMLFAASDDYKKYIFILLVVVIIAAVIIIIVANADTTDGNGFRFGRIYNWLHPSTSGDSEATQTMYGLYAIGNGGFWGKGLGESVMKYKLPEATNDMIFSVICEELGLVGAVALIVLYIFLISKIYMVARATKNKFGFLVTVGVMTHIGIQAIMNIAVATNSMPNTGVSLPFISSGGSSAVTLLAEMGLVFAVNRINNKEEKA